PKNAKLFFFYEADKTTGKDDSFYWKKRSKGTFCIDSTPLPVCKNVRHRNRKTFKNMANWAHSSVSTTFGLKLHLVLNASRKFVKFSLKPGNLHDVSCAEEVLDGCTGTVVGDGGYVSTALRDSLAKRVYG
ncbi:MAG: transposase, partial [Puniceicoccales bacterium]|nr:transposase [Puniceicoccales bacterium]